MGNARAARSVTAVKNLACCSLLILFLKIITMILQELKRELLSFIETTDDETLLSLLKEDIQFYAHHQGTDVTDGLRGSN